MGCLGNVLWFVFGGAVSGLSWCLAGCLWCITVVGIPVGMQRFQRELRDVQVSLDLRMEIGSFLSFADFFLDGLVADYMVQSKIADAREQVDDAINRIEKILADVKNRMNGEV